MPPGDDGEGEATILIVRPARPTKDRSPRYSEYQSKEHFKISLFLNSSRVAIVVQARQHKVTWRRFWSRVEVVLELTHHPVDANFSPAPIADRAIAISLTYFLTVNR